MSDVHTEMRLVVDGRVSEEVREYRKRLTEEERVYKRESEGV
jgi:hypothetical protein